MWNSSGWDRWHALCCGCRWFGPWWQCSRANRVVQHSNRGVCYGMALVGWVNLIAHLFFLIRDLICPEDWWRPRECQVLTTELSLWWEEKQKINKAERKFIKSVAPTAIVRGPNWTSNFLLLAPIYLLLRRLISYEENQTILFGSPFIFLKSVICWITLNSFLLLPAWIDNYFIMRFCGFHSSFCWRPATYIYLFTCITRNVKIAFKT